MESGNLDVRERCSLYLGRIAIEGIDSFLVSMNADSRALISFYTVLESICRLAELNYYVSKSNEKR